MISIRLFVGLMALELILVFRACAQDFASHESEIKIDPRQYVTVQYRKFRTQTRLDTLWNWENRKNIPNQKIGYIDVDGEIKIDFSKAGLIANKFFEGTVSLEAEISGLSGTRKIEVNPYSEIGVQRKPIGIRSDPPAEIAKKLLNMISELKGAYSAFSSIYTYYSAESIAQKKEFLAKKKEIDGLIRDRKVDIGEIKTVALELVELGGRNFNVFFSDVPDPQEPIKSKINNSANRQELQNNVNLVSKAYLEQANEQRDYFINSYKDILLFSINKLDITILYLNSFEASGEDAVKALLSLINKDIVNYNSLKNSLLSSKSELAKINIKMNDRDSLAVLFSEKAPEILEATNRLSKYTRFKGSVLEQEIKKIIKRDNLTTTYYDSVGIVNPGRKYTLNTAQLERLEENLYFRVIEEYLPEISANLSSAAGKMIYRKLVYAAIDLGKSGAKSGEVLNIYVTWILDSTRDSLSSSPRLPVGKYYLRETGWRMEIADMFSLVKRIREPDVNQTAVSPTNFKGSGGAVLMWTFNKEDKGIQISKMGERDIIKRKNRFWNSLEPSLGLNVSYLDFSTEKDVEIGTGLQLGVFKNKIFFGYGLNLHMISPKNQSPTYLYVGFSFARLSDLFKNSNSVVAAQ